MASVPARIVILASGSGSNAERIIKHFSTGGAGEQVARVVAVVSDRKRAGVHNRAASHDIPSRFVGKTRRSAPGGLLEVLEAYTPDIVVLAGYLRLIPEDVLARFAERVVNIHPALLPHYGGHGMFGEHVHKAVAAAGETHSGITIHLANQRYDEGRILFQASVSFPHGSAALDIGARVLELEHQHYPLVLEAYLKKF